MIRRNLAVLLAQRSLKITKVSKDTHISRTTLTAICQNECKGIQFDTLNLLCEYLNVSPSEILEFYPLDISEINIQTNEIISINDSFPIESFTVSFSLKYNKSTISCSIDGKIEHDAMEIPNGTLYPANIIFKKFNEKTVDIELITKIINNLPANILTTLENTLSSNIIKNSKILPKNCKTNNHNIFCDIKDLNLGVHLPIRRF